MDYRLSGMKASSSATEKLCESCEDGEADFAKLQDLDILVLSRAASGPKKYPAGDIRTVCGRSYETTATRLRGRYAIRMSRAGPNEAIGTISFRPP
jgi:hypothetical protein